jgi:hypothetical protein
MDIPMDLKTLGLLLAILFFLISLLVNLFQYRTCKGRVNRLLNSEGAVLHFLMGLHTTLGKLESACTFEMEEASSPKEIGRSVRMARNQIQSTIAEIQKNLRSFREYRREEKADEKHKKHMEKLRKKRLGK